MARRVERVFDLKVTLRHITPPIWRLVRVKGNTRLSRLHDVLQATMGWWNCHLHQYDVGGRAIGLVDMDSVGELDDERDFTLTQIASEHDHFVYEYDFGDGWKHDIIIEEELVAEPGVRYPVILDGGRACPKEDCGGPPGYEQLIEVLKDSTHEEHAEMKDWAGDDFDPERFDRKAIDAALERVRPRAKRRSASGWVLPSN